jgi:hypothetical protein
MSTLSQAVAVQHGDRGKEHKVVGVQLSAVEGTER